jgi:hypothetical protein
MRYMLRLWILKRRRRRGTHLCTVGSCKRDPVVETRCGHCGEHYFPPARSLTEKSKP